MSGVQDRSGGSESERATTDVDDEDEWEEDSVVSAEFVLMSDNKEPCPTCRSYDCEEQGGRACDLRKDINTLAAALRSVIKTKLDPDAVKTALVVLDQISPSSHHCPVCETPGVVRNNVVQVHFASVTQDRPCRASYGTVLGGVLVEKRGR